MRWSRRIHPVPRFLPALVLALAIPGPVHAQGGADSLPGRAAAFSEDWAPPVGGAISRATVSRAARAATTTEADGGWTRLTISGRARHSATFDPVRQRMIVFGGWSAVAETTLFNDVWVLPLAGPPRCLPLVTAGTPPPVRRGHSAVYDPVRDRLLVFGGWTRQGGDGLYLADVWALSLGEDPPTWTQLAPTGTPPGGRCAQVGVYDPGSDRMVLFGGEPLNNEVWALSLAGTPAWAQLSPTGTPPVARRFMSAIFDPVRDRMVLFGGTTGSADLNDVWALSLGGAPAWSVVTPSGTSPSGRYATVAVYDPVRDRMVVFGGRSSSVVYVVTLALSLADPPSWTTLQQSVCVPSDGCILPRYDHAAIYDPAGDRMVVFGGRGSSQFLDDFGAFSLADPQTWTRLGPRQCTGASMIADPVGDRLVVFGGRPGSYTYPNDVWTLSLGSEPGWSLQAPTGTPPSARWLHSAMYDPLRQRMVISGGLDAFGVLLTDVWVLSLTDPPAWTQTTSVPWGGSYAHSTIYDPVRDRMILFPGPGNSVWALPLAGTPAWTQLLAPSAMPPGARTYLSAIYDPVRDRMIVFGGNEGATGAYLNDVWALSLSDTPTWTAITPTGTPPIGRRAHTAIYDPVRDRMIVFGGNDGITGAAYDDVWALALSGTPAWTQLAPTGTLPNARVSHGAAYDTVRDRMLVCGGFDGSFYFADVLALEWSTAAAVDDGGPPVLAGFIGQPVPNPARGSIAVRYSVARAGRVRLDVYDAGGRRVRRLVDRESPGGAGVASWDGVSDSGARLGAGVYFVRLVGPGTSAARRVVLLN